MLNANSQTVVICWAVYANEILLSFFSCRGLRVVLIAQAGETTHTHTPRDYCIIMLSKCDTCIPAGLHLPAMKRVLRCTVVAAAGVSRSARLARRTWIPYDDVRQAGKQQTTERRRKTDDHSLAWSVGRQVLLPVSQSVGAMSVRAGLYEQCITRVLAQ